VYVMLWTHLYWCAVYSSSNLRIIFWYCVLYFLASFLKKSTLVLLRAIVTLTVSSFRASSSGEGRKSEMTLTFPIGSSVYFIFPFIYLFPFPPVSGADNSDFIFSMGKSYGHNSASDSIKTIIPLFLITVFQIFQNDTMIIQKSKLQQGKGDAVFLLIQFVFGGIPLKIRSFYDITKILKIKVCVNIFIWLFICTLSITGLTGRTKTALTHRKSDFLSLAHRRAVRLSKVFGAAHHLHLKFKRVARQFSLTFFCNIAFIAFSNALLNFSGRSIIKKWSASFRTMASNENICLRFAS
jgi:hypothetical protein